MSGISSDETVAGQIKCRACGSPVELHSGRGRRPNYCGPGCWPSNNIDYEAPGRTRRGASRRPLGDFASTAGWALRKDVERLERIFADDRFPQNKEQVATHLRSHLQFAAEVCQDLLSQITTPLGD